MKSRLMMIAWLVVAPWALSASEALRVDFVEPERYTDLRLSGSTTERIQTYILEELERYLQDLAALLTAFAYALSHRIRPGRGRRV